ncbi:hypothetical protein Tco_0126683 [Tanacetum coccineum]
MSNLKFAKTHNLVAFLEKPKESDGFEGIIDFLNASSIRYALTVNPTIYTSCIKQFWATAKAKTVNGEVHIQALVDGKKVIVTETKLERMGYENLTQKLTFYKAFFSPQWKFLIHTILQCISAKTTAWNEFSSTVASAIILFLDKQVEGMTKHKEIYVTPFHTKKVFANMKRGGKGFSEPMVDKTKNVESVPIHSNDPLLSGEDRLQLKELLEFYTKLSERVLDLENTKTSQAAEITKLKERVKKLEKRNKSRTPGLKRLKKIGRSAQVVSYEDEGLGTQEDASKQGMKLTDLDVDAEVTLVNEAQGRNDDNLMFDTRVFDEQEIEVEKAVSTAEVTTVSATTTTIDELTLAQTLIEIKAAKPKAVTTATTTTTTTVTRPKARGVIVQEPKIAQKLQAQLNAKLEEEEKLAKQREEDANIAEWDNVQAMIDADYELAARLQAQEQE